MGKHIAVWIFTMGVISSSLIVSARLILMILAVVISTLMRGNAGIYVGLMMFLALIASALGFGIGIKSFDEENRFMMYTYIGTICNAVIWIFILGIYLIFV